MNFLLDSNALILSKGRISVTTSVGYAEDSDRHNSICPINLIWSRYYIDASTSFLSGQCVYMWVKVEYHKIIWVGMAYREDVSIWN